MYSYYKAVYGELFFGFLLSLGILWWVLNKYVGFWDVLGITIGLFIINLGIRRWFEIMLDDGVFE